jgi:hypothetical protein
MFPGVSCTSLEQRWLDWVARDATVTTRKDQADDTAGVSFEFLRTRILLRPSHTHTDRGDCRTETRASAIRAEYITVQAVQPVGATAITVGACFAEGLRIRSWNYSAGTDRRRRLKSLSGFSADNADTSASVPLRIEEDGMRAPAFSSRIE